MEDKEPVKLDDKGNEIGVMRVVPKGRYTGKITQIRVKDRESNSMDLLVIAKVVYDDFPDTYVWITLYICKRYPSCFYWHKHVLEPFYQGLSGLSVWIYSRPTEYQNRQFNSATFEGIIQTCLEQCSSGECETTPDSSSPSTPHQSMPPSSRLKYLRRLGRSVSILLLRLLGAKSHPSQKRGKE